MYLHEAWYQFGWAEEVLPKQHLVRKILDETIFLWRSEGGHLAAVINRCPHRFAPFSEGHIKGESIACGYHGATFGADGRCVHNPHGPAPASLKVRAFPVVERHRAIWIWMGAEQNANPDLIPDLSFIDETPLTETVIASIPTKANYQLIIDNILDLSHIDYLHPQTLGKMMTGAKARYYQKGDVVYGEWIATNAETPLAYRAMVPYGNCDLHIRLKYIMPGCLILENTVVPTGTEPSFKDLRTTMHNMTPETQTTSHYFVSSVRRFKKEDTAVTEQIKKALLAAFIDEDKPLLEKQQTAMGTPDFYSLKPVLLKIDTAAVLARRVLDEKIRGQAAQNAA